jgi:glycine cleavage system aminomethyltransferase T
MSTLDEHQALVERAGAFAADGFGQFEVTGQDAGALVNRIATVDVSRLPAGRFAHALLLRDDATILERVTVYRFPDRVLLLVDTGGREAAWEHLVARDRATARHFRRCGAHCGARADGSVAARAGAASDAERAG